ncbi:MAG: PilZ domain-containing protein [Candidatus Acidiferrales bacterium]
MADLNTLDDPGSLKRRSTRVVQAVPIIVSGADALGQSFKERTSTVMVNCHGCKYQSKHYVPKNSWVSLEIPRQESSAPMFVVRGRVVWVQRPRTVRELFQIGVEFEIAGNYWGIAFPPEDWYTGATGLTGDIPAPAHRAAPLGGADPGEPP